MTTVGLDLLVVIVPLFRGDELESSALVDAAGGGEHAMRPEKAAVIAALHKAGLIVARSQSRSIDEIMIVRDGQPKPLSGVTPLIDLEKSWSSGLLDSNQSGYAFVITGAP